MSDPVTNIGAWALPVAVLGGAVRVGTPYLFVSLGECLTERHVDGGVSQAVFLRPPYVDPSLPPEQAIRELIGMNVYAIVAGKLYAEITLLGKDKAVIVDPKTNKTTNIHKQSTEYMLDSYAQNFDPEYKALTKKKPDFKGAPTPISENAKLFIKACELYQKNYPAEKKNIKNCDVVITDIFYFSNDKERAKKYLMMLAEKYPNDPEGKGAVVESQVPARLDWSMASRIS